MCGKLIDHDCWECVIAEEDGRVRCSVHLPPEPEEVELDKED